MGKYLGLLLALIMVTVGGFGYVYFGPPQHTRIISRTDFYRNHVGPLLDRIFLSNSQNSVSVGYLLESRGDLTYRPSSELVFLPARDGQRLFGGTLVSTGP